MDILQRLFGPGQLQPTEDGYQAPPGALATGWQCHDPDCGEAGYFPAPRPSIPRRCGACGSGTYPRHAWPWQHGERRAELDALQRRAQRDGDTYLALPVHFYLLSWTFEEHLMNGDRGAALAVLGDADGQLRTAMKERRHFTEGSHRTMFVLSALRSGDPDIALRVLEPWAALARAQGPGYGTDLESDNASRTNYRSLVSSCFEWLEDGRTAPQSHPAYDTVVGWALDTARAAHVRDWLTTDQEQRLNRLDPYWRHVR
ncbi:hypothetical protein ABZ612_12960 [Streptomyces avermitilis]|uniref:hypothetical protein n=1 Tax=Streptomyces avermitilis TaxID=33903 RepID=UPI003400B36C